MTKVSATEPHFLDGPVSRACWYTPPVSAYGVDGVDAVVVAAVDVCMNGGHSVCSSVRAFSVPPVTGMGDMSSGEEAVPRQLSSMEYARGSVRQMCPLADGRLAVATVRGDVSILRPLTTASGATEKTDTGAHNDELALSLTFAEASTLSVSKMCVTGVAVQPARQPLLAVTSEDGLVMLLDVDKAVIALQSGVPDTLALTGVCWQDSNCLLCTSGGGQLSLYDIRDKFERAALVVQSSQRTPLSCVAVQPQQSSRAATGDVLGVVSLYDFRGGDRASVETVSAHESPVVDLKFKENAAVSAGRDGSCAITTGTIDTRGRFSGRQPHTSSRQYMYCTSFSSVDIHRDALLFGCQGGFVLDAYHD